MKKITHFYKEYGFHLNPNELSVETNEIGRVIGEYQHIYNIKTAYSTVNAIITGKDKHRNKNNNEYPVIGDWVLLNTATGNDTATITKILDRKNLLNRYSKTHKVLNLTALAANVDNIIVVFGVDQQFNKKHILQYIYFGLSHHCNVYFVFNKIDLKSYKDDNYQYVSTVIKTENIIAMSAKKDVSLTKLLDKINPYSTNILIGPSGSGKSSIINNLMGSTTQETKPVNSVGFGQHTTTSYHLFSTKSNHLFVDTPGIRNLSFSLINTKLSLIFPNISNYENRCKFRNCTHNNEPDCYINYALKENLIDKSSLKHYLYLKKMNKS